MGKHRGRHRMKTVYEKGFAIREWTNRTGYYVVDFQVGGVRVRKGFGSLEDAKGFCQTKRTEITNRGIQSLNFSEQARADALAAMRALEGTGATILEAAQEYARRHPAAPSETVRQTCDRYLDGMLANGRRPLSVYEKRLKFNRLCKTFGTVPMTSIDESDIRTWASTLGLSSVTTKAHVGAGMSLLRFFQGKLEGRSSADQKPPVTWDVTTVSTLFAKAEKFVPQVVPALTVLFFAGIRPHEMMRLSWAEIDLGARVIRLTGEHTKTRTMRNIDLSDNAIAWLSAYQGAGPIVASRALYRTLQVKLMEKCGITEWPPDVARHTFATMHYNAHQNAAATMAQLGHFGNPQTFVTHYKGVQASAANVKAFWKIRPHRAKSRS